MWGDDHAEAVPTALTATGLVLAVLTVAETGYRLLGPAPTSGMFLAGLATSLPFVALVVAGGIHLDRATVSTRFYPRVLAWCGVAAVGFGGLILLFTPLIFDTRLEYLGTVRWAVSIGVGGGFLIGYFNVRMIERTVAAERAAVRAEEADRRREFLEYLNALLRHEVLNAANVIDGRAELAERVAGSEAVGDHTAIISRQAADLTGVIKDVRFLVNATDATDATEPIDAAELIRTELDELTDRHETVTVETDLPETVRVTADDLLPRLFRNLFENAAEHGADTLVVQCAVEEGVTVRITDDGPGVPPDLRDGLFDPTISRRDDESRLGTVIVGRLAERYDGRVELADTGPDGTTVVVELPAADHESVESPPAEPSLRVS